MSDGRKEMRTKEKDRKKNKRNGKKKKMKMKKQGRYGHFIFPMYFKQTREVVLPNVFQNGSNSTREAAPSEEPEPELFLEELEPCQTGPDSIAQAKPVNELTVALSSYCSNLMSSVSRA